MKIELPKSKYSEHQKEMLEIINVFCQHKYSLFKGVGKVQTAITNKSKRK